MSGFAQPIKIGGFKMDKKLKVLTITMLVTALVMIYLFLPYW